MTQEERFKELDRAFKQFADILLLENKKLLESVHLMDHYPLRMCGETTEKALGTYLKIVEAFDFFKGTISGMEGVLETRRKKKEA
jgi:hypothetical protein